MLSLLETPREIRDSIIKLVLFSGRPAPARHDYVSIPARKPIVDVRYESWLGSNGVMYEPETVQPAATPLLLVNRQLHIETKHALERTPGRGHRYTLDLMFVEERELWPTWTLIPAFTQQIDALDVTIRVVGGHTGFGGGYSENRTIWDIGNGAPPAVVWVFYSLLERFLKAGPVGNTPEPYIKGNARSGQLSEVEASNIGLVDRSVTVKQLNLNFVSPADRTELADPDSRNEWRRARNSILYRRLSATLEEEKPERERLQRKAMRPEWLADYLVSHLRSLLSMGYHMARYGRLLYERIGDITVSVDGEVTTDFKLPRRLSVLQFNDSFGSEFIAHEDRLDYFDKWKKHAFAVREKAGLPIEPFLEENQNSD